MVEWLRSKKAPGVAEAYMTALEVEARGPFIGAGSLIAHCLRDLLNRLADAFYENPGELVPYPKLAKAIEKAWGDPGSDSVSAVGQVAIAQEADRAVRALLAEHRRGTARNVNKIVVVLESELGADGRSPASRQAIDELLEIKEWAPEAAHFICVDEKRVDFDFAVRQLRSVEKRLLALSRPFFAHVSEIDDIIQDANS